MALNDALRQSFRRQLAADLLENLSAESRHRHFLFIGKPTPWDVDTSPDDATDSDQVMADAHRSIIGMKLIRPEDASLVVSRIDWEYGATYDQYDHTEDMSGKRFFVLTDEYNVYKCLSNNNGSVSTTKPTGTSPYTFTTDGDGYRWKFIMKVPESGLKFLTDEFMPVSKAAGRSIDELQPQFEAQEAAIDGSIDSYEVTTSAAVYGKSKAKSYKIGNPADGGVVDPTTGQALSTDEVNVAGSRFVKLAKNMVLDDPLAELNDYYNGYSIYIILGRGNEVGQILNIVDYHGPSRTAYVWPPLSADLFQDESVDAGATILPATKYRIVPSILIEGDGLNASAWCVTNGSGVVTSVLPIGRGSGYTIATATITTTPDSGSAPTITPMIGPPGGHASDAVSELGASHLMVSVEIDGDEGGKFSLANDYRQFGIIRDPILRDSDGTVAGTETDRTALMTVTKPWFADFAFSETTFKVGSLIKGQSSNAIGKVVRWDNGIIEIAPLSGRFQPPTKTNQVRIAMSDTSGGTFTVGSRVFQSSNFDLLSEGTVVSWNPGATFAPELVVLVDYGSFDSSIGISQADGAAQCSSDTILAIEPLGGELLSQLEFDDEMAMSFTSVAATGPSGPSSTQLIARIAEFDPTKAVDDASVGYRQTWLLTIGGITGTVFDSNSFDEDKTIWQTDEATGAKVLATIVSWTTGGGTTGEMEVTDVRGTLSPKVSGVGGGFDYEDGLPSSFAGICILDAAKPEVEVGSGEMLYIQNIRPVTRDIEQGERFRIQIGF